jgi:anti-sigma regulatory factor (Ser/Thr protein kinase)
MRLSAEQGLDEIDAGRVGLVVTELATNILKHASKGHVLIRALRDGENAGGIESIAIDRGPGISDINRCFEDGYSTAGSPGTGLGAVKRAAPTVEIYTGPGSGTAVFAQVMARKSKPAPSETPWVFGSIHVPAPGQVECGDDFGADASSTSAQVLVVDGLGHGPEAAKAASTAVRVFNARRNAQPEQLLTEMHVALKATRGAAAAYAMVDLTTQVVRFTGVGNVHGIVAWPGGARHLVTQNGTLGSQLGRVHVYEYPWHMGASLVMHTDGLTSQLDTRAFPGLHSKHPTLMAAVLYRDFLRGRDDATVVIAQQSRSK